MRRVFRRFTPVLAGVAVVVALLSLRAGLPDLFERARLAGFDVMQRALPRQRGEDVAVRVVDIDDESLRRHGQWPWSRDLVARLVGNLQDLSAASVALDIVFAEADRTSPAYLAESWGAAYGWSPAGESKQPLPDHDRTLAAVFARGRVVTGYGLLFADNGAVAPPAPSFALVGGEGAGAITRFAGVIPNIPVLEAAAAGHGSFTIAAGRDEIVRRLPILAMLRGRMTPSLALEALRVAQGEEVVIVRADQEAGAFGAVTGHTARVGSLDIPLDAEGALWLHHSGTVSQRSIPAWRLMEADAGASVKDEVAGRITLIGASAVGLSDLRPTPLNAFEPGIAIHAEALEQILSGGYLARPAWAGGAEVVASVCLALLAIVCAAYAGLRASAALAVGLVGAIWAGVWLLFGKSALLVDGSLPSLLVLGGFSAASLSRHLLEERGALHLRAAFTHYLSPELVKALASDPSRLKLGGETREMTFLFTDLQGFTSLTESRGAEALVALLNGYLDGLCGVAMEHGGTVDKIVGDAVHVMFNAPLDQPDHAARAVRCALAMDVFATAFSTARQGEGVPFGETRIGVNTGLAVVGNFGGARRFDYTAHGDAINTAARLEAANKALGTRICVAEATVARCEGQGLVFRPIGTLLLRGKAQGVEVHEPAAIGAEPSAFDARYRDAFARLMAEDETGADDLLTLHAERPDDSVVALHARRIAAGMRSLRIAA